MVRMNIVIPNNVNSKFRKQICKNGYSKGDYSKIITQVIEDWIKKNSHSNLRSSSKKHSHRRRRKVRH